MAQGAEVAHNDARMIARRDLAVRVDRIEPLSPTCFRLLLSCAEPVEAQPGQFGMLACGDGLDPLLRRAFSIAGVRPARGATGSTIELMIKEVGKGSSALRRIAPGTATRLLAPLGTGFTLDAGGAPFALVAGGIGLPPILFAAEELARRGTRFDLIAGASSVAELIEIERCAVAVAAVGGEFVPCTDDGSRGEPGFVTAALERRLDAGRRWARLLACGPDPMLKALARLARAHGLTAELSLEEPMACGVGVCLGCVVELADGRMVSTCTHGPVFDAAALAARWSQ